ncbi:LysR family transcriptional regulator [Paraburkholderia bannensis]|uniref:LysR family transcriptional regulator n=1 Tax=Paraburkholderia bannensis TaxID=765414 RepID=UPI002AB651A3|nr:LysR family transcriptional regulator [Paraburkholderia bannensis]
MDRIDLFRVFVRVVVCANFTRAADTLGMPRSSVSAAIQELENRVGTRLLNRTTRKVTTTQDGAALYDRCLRLIADVEETENLFRSADVSSAGTLRVDMPSRIGRLIVTPALPAFLDAYPQIDVEINATDRPVDLIEERIDCALRVGTLNESELIARPIGTLALINVASPAYLARHGTPRDPDDLAYHTPIGYASPASGRLAPWEWVDGDRTRTLAIKGRVTVNNAEAYIACCLTGLGLIQIPAYDVEAHIRAGELVEVLPGYRAPPMPVTLLYLHRQYLSRRFQVFADWFVELVRIQCCAQIETIPLR